MVDLPATIMAKHSLGQSVRAFQKEAEVETFYVNIFDGLLMFCEVKQHYLGIDILTRNLLIEVKFDQNIEKNWAEILAQALYYQYTLLTLGESPRPYLAVVDEDEVCIFESEKLRHIWANEPLFSQIKSEVSCASDAHQSKTLMNAIQSRDITCWYFHDRAKGVEKLREIEQFDQPQQRPIQLNNVIEAFDDWEEIVRDYLKNNGIENAFIFYEDATGKGIVSTTKELSGSRLTITFEKYGAIINRIPEGDYQKFAKQWKRIRPHSKEAQDIERRLYELIEMDRRRALGQFYTPSKIAKIAWNMFVQQLGESFWQDGTWRIWDNCAGSGNLEYEIIPQDALQYTYLSTINADEVEFLKENNYFKGKCRAIFQFDYLNDTEKKLPQQLKDDLKNPSLKWLFFINPPYKEAGTALGNTFARGVKISNVAEEMKHRKLGKCANEIKMQFLYRIERDFGKRGYYLGLFSKAKWITKPSSEAFRKIWLPKLDGGFMLNANEHFIQQRNEKHELKAQGTFPVIFSLLNRLQKTKTTWEEQNWTYALLDETAKRTGKEKTFGVFDKKRVDLRQYFFPPCKEERIKSLPVMSGAVMPTDGKTLVDNAARNCVGAMALAAIDFQHFNMCYLMSGLHATNAIHITTDNYRSILIGFALYKSVKYDWTRDADIFYAPYRDLTKEEIADCLLYALLNGANNTGYTTVKTENDTFILLNWFNPFDKAKFDFVSEEGLPLSVVGRAAFNELMNYCNKIVKWKKLDTQYGHGVWLGLYQYRTSYDAVNKTYKKKFGKDYPNQDLYGIPYPDSFKAAIEALRQRVEALAIDLCLTAGKEITRTRDTFLERKKQQRDLVE